MSEVADRIYKVAPTYSNDLRSSELAFVGLLLPASLSFIEIATGNVQPMWLPLVHGLVVFFLVYLFLIGIELYSLSKTARVWLDLRRSVYSVKPEKHTTTLNELTDQDFSAEILACQFRNKFDAANSSIMSASHYYGPIKKPVIAFCLGALFGGIEMFI